MNLPKNTGIDHPGNNSFLPSASVAVEETLNTEEWGDFLKILTTYRLKGVSRNSSNTQIGRDGIPFYRKETTAEHIYSSMKLAWYFLDKSEFRTLDKIRVFGLILYHDDIEIPEGDTSIDDIVGRKNKEKREIDALPGLIAEYPKLLGQDLASLDTEFRAGKTAEAKFGHAIDKMDALVHELQYPEDWGPKGFGEEKVREYFQGAFEYSPTFMKYFETLINYLRENGYFEKKILIGQINLPPRFFELIIPELEKTGDITALESFRVGRILGTEEGNAAARELTGILENHKKDKKKSAKQK